MRSPSLECVDNINCELESIVRNCGKNIEMFPKLKYKFIKKFILLTIILFHYYIIFCRELYVNTTLEYLRECNEKCRLMVEHKVDTEQSYMSATHVNFVKPIRFVYLRFNFMTIFKLLALKRNRFPQPKQQTHAPSTK